MLHLLRRHIRDERVIDAMAAIPREHFVPAQLRSRAYDDNALPIGEGQTISQPLMVALMVEALRLSPSDIVLEVGTGLGYAAAVLSRLARQVITVDRIPEFCAHASRLFAELHLENVSVHNAGEELGYRRSAPYDAVLVSAGAPHVPRSLLDQLAEGGRLVVPIGSRRQQELVRASATAHGIELVRIGPCAFVPLIGDDAWDDHSESVGRPIVP